MSTLNAYFKIENLKELYIRNLLINYAEFVNVHNKSHNTTEYSHYRKS
jgi:hypothetical protein